MTIRELDPSRDVRAVLALIREAAPTAVINEAALMYRLQTIPARSLPRSFVAEIDGRIVGRSESRLDNFFSDDPGTGFIAVQVAAAHRGLGVGARLYDEALEHLDEIGASRLLSMFYENEDGVRFAHARGFVEVRAEQESILDPRLVDEEPSSAVDLQPVAEVDPRLVHAVDEAATRDLPASEEIKAIPYDEWVAHVLEYPLFTAAGSLVAIVDGIAAAVSLLLFDPETGRAANMFTGTLREHRGRGLARAVKLGSIRWAAENGATSIVTTNDETNAAMLAINRRLGYVPGSRRVEVLQGEGLLGERSEHL